MKILYIPYNSEVYTLSKNLVVISAVRRVSIFAFLLSLVFNEWYLL